MSVSLIVNGAFGKMGQLAVETLAQYPEFNVVAALSKNDNLAQTLKETKAKIVLDLTRADVVFANATTIIEHGAHPVIGTSGLTDKEYAQLKELSDAQGLGGIIAPNFSIGAILMMRFAQMAAQYLPDVEIIEAHHTQKYDAPSGTAIKTAEMIAKVREKATMIPSHESLAGARGGNHHGIPIHSIRLPGILARQQVIFGQTGETLTLYHDSIDRRCFMPGIVLCCQKVLELNTLYYGMESLV